MSWMHDLVERLMPRRVSRAALERLADSLAERGAEAVWQRTRARVANMRLAEARGYIRARAAQVMHDQVDAELQGRPALYGRYRAVLIAAATESVVHMTLHTLTSLHHHRRSARAA